MPRPPHPALHGPLWPPAQLVPKGLAGALRAGCWALGQAWGLAAHCLPLMTTCRVSGCQQLRSSCLHKEAVFND